MLRIEDIAPGLIVKPLTMDNERLFIGDGETVNYYAVVTNFYVNALWGQYPRVEGDPFSLLRAFENATQQRSINGFGGIAVSGDNITVLNSRFLFPLVDELSNRIGWVAMFPWNSKKEATSYPRLADRIRILIGEDDKPIGEEADYAYSGSTLGTRLNYHQIPLTLSVFGDGLSDYTNMKFLVTEINNRLSGNKEVLDRHSNPHIQGPASAAPQPMTDTVTGEITQAGFRYDKEGMFLPRDNEEGGYEYLGWDPQTNLGQLQIDRVIDLLHVTTGVPASAFGLINNANSSGVSLERQMFAALSKVRRWRRDIEQAASLLGVNNMTWVEDPFADFKERVESEIALVDAGIITTQESRERLNIA